jgi:hypothetical protein
LNGKDIAKSIINFVLDPSGLNQAVYECNTVFPDNNMEGFQNITSCPCTYCDLACPVPDVNGDIAFFDGCDWFLVGMAYVYVVIFTVVIQIVKRYYASKYEEEEKKEKERDQEEIKDTFTKSQSKKI